MAVNDGGSNPPLSVVCFKWHTEGYRATFTSEHVNTLRNMVARHYASPHRFICFTDDPEGIDSGIETYPVWDDYANIPNPTGGGRPSCYRRLKLFDPAMAEILGPRFVSIDLDCVVVGDLAPVFDREEDVVFWAQPSNLWPYNGAMFMANTGARPEIWTDFDPERSPILTTQKGYRGSDQAWFSYRCPDEATWGVEDGVLYYRLMKDRSKIPDGARIFFTTAGNPPWDLPYPWIKEHYR